MRARASHVRERGEDVVVFSLDGRNIFELNPNEAERLLYDLHTICTVLRGVNKPLRLRDRWLNIGRALGGHQ